MAKRPTYPSDLTEREWRLLAPLVPDLKLGGRPGEHSRREIINAIFYVLRTGCQWRYLPHDLLPWKTVYTYYRNWRKDGTWQRIHDELREQLRAASGRHRPVPGGVRRDVACAGRVELAVRLLVAPASLPRPLLAGAVVVARFTCVFFWLFSEWVQRKPP